VTGRDADDLRAGPPLPVKWDHRPLRHRLPGGATFVAVPLPHLHRATLSLLFAAGSRYESPADNGLAHFTEHMLFRGTSRFPTPVDLNRAIENLGGTLEASTGPDTTELSVTLPEGMVEAGVEILAEVATRPRFNDIEVERKVVAEEIQEDLDEHGDSIDVDFLSRSRLWPDQPLGQSVTGPLANVMRFSREDLERQMAARMVAPGTVICVAGRFDAEPVRRAVERCFASMPTKASPAASLAARPGRGPTVLHRYKPGSQTQVRVAFTAFGDEDPDAMALALLERLVDDGMSTPLHRRVFEERGLAYAVSAGLELYPDTGAYEVDASCIHDNVPDLVAEILALLREQRAAPPDPADLDKARRRAVWELEGSQDRSLAMATWYGVQALFGRERTLESEARNLWAVTAEQVTRAAGRVLRGDGLHITTVGVLGAAGRRAVARLAAGFA
jgi:predicted Zn-dependent peptidase